MCCVHPSTIAFLRGLLTLVLVVVVAAAAGAGAGYGLSQAFGTDASAADEIGATGASGATARAGSATNGSSSAKSQPTPRLTVLSATFKLATSPSGVARKRARVTVRLRARNPGKTSTTLGTAQIEALGDSLKADPKAKDQAGKLLDPISGGDTVTGELRFETAGDLTDTLNTTRSATLRVGKKTLALDLTRVGG